MNAATGGIALIIGSGPNAPVASTWDRAPFTHVVAINNAWRVRPDWDYAIYPDDFPNDRRPAATALQVTVEARDYVPVQNRFGGFVYAGGTMAFTAGYWALGALRPSVMAFIGCDMVYPSVGKTHFYGMGLPDPLRADVTLQSLEAKSARLALVAAAHGCQCVNLSEGPSRLVFPRAGIGGLSQAVGLLPDAAAMEAAQGREAALGYMVEDGRYWEAQERFDARELRAVDDLWLAAWHASTEPAAMTLPKRGGGRAAL